MAGGVLLVGCATAPKPIETVRAAATKTALASTARMSASIKSVSGPLAKGVTYDGEFDFAAHRGRFSFDASALGLPTSAGNLDAVFDYESGAVVYVKYPQIAQVIAGKSWIKVDVGAATAKATGVDMSSLFVSQGSDPTSGLRLLTGASQVTKVGSEPVRGTPTTHFHVITDINKAADAAPPQARDALQKLAALYVVKTVPVDVWLDAQNRMRRYEQVADPANLKLPAPAQAAASAAGPVTIHLELFDFGAAVDVQIPPQDQIADLSQLQRTASTPATPPPPAGPTSPAKGAYLARANAICSTMNAKTTALPDPGTDPLQQATVTSQAVAITEDALRQLRALPVPAGDAVTISAILSKVDVVVADANKLAAALRSGDQAQSRTLEAQLQTDTTSANTAAVAYGLTVCGS